MSLRLLYVQCSRTNVSSQITYLAFGNNGVLELNVCFCGDHKHTGTYKFCMKLFLQSRQLCSRLTSGVYLANTAELTSGNYT